MLKISTPLNHLSHRDLSIIEFLNEMGPCTMQILAVRFFSFLSSPNPQTRLRVTRRRIEKLKTQALVKQIKAFRKEPLYVATGKGVKYLSYLKESTLKPAKNLTPDLYHSMQICWSRIVMEKMGSITHWRSERRLHFEDKPLQQQKLNHSYIPDGLYTRADHSFILFEMETTQKSISRMKERIEILTNLIVNMNSHYQGVHIICQNDTIKTHYQNICSIWDQKIQTFKELMLEGGISYELK